MKTWYDRIRELREDLPEKKSQTEIAAELKITQRKLSYIETGKTEPNIEDIIRICKYYNVSADYILGLEDKKLNTSPQYNKTINTTINGDHHKITIK